MLAGEATVALGNWIDAGVADLEELARSRAHREPGNLEELASRSDHFAGFALVDRDGAISAKTGSAASLERTPELRRLPDREAPVQLLPATSGPTLVAAVPLARRDRPHTALLAVFRLPDLAALIGREPLESTHLRIVDDAGRDVVMGTAASPRRAGEVPMQVADDGPQAPLLSYSGPDGQHWISATHEVSDLPLNAVVERTFADAFEPVLTLLTRVFIVDLLVILAFSYLAYRTTSWLVRPLEALSDAARRIAQGHFELEISESASQDEIGLLTRTFNDMMRKVRGYQVDIETANEALLDRNVDLQRKKEQYEQLSITDGLTKLHNHRFFQDHLTREIKRVNRVREPLSMLLMDVDGFKGLNDRLGHAAGDELLKRLAEIMSDSIRESDLLARYGGDEFAVLASNSDAEGAYTIGEKILMAVADSSFILDDSLRPARVTLSIGVAQYSGNRDRFFKAADRALYKAKSEGKNCVVVDDNEIAI
jgi:diguanylate cyclase (GGDEF)-like protein